MKKGLHSLCLTVVMLFCSCGCSLFANKTVKTTHFLANLDYGQITEGRVTVLLGDSLVFFEPSNYGIENIVAGDDICVSHTGELLALETYPSRVVTTDRQIQNVTVTPASISAYQIVKEQDGSISLLKNSGTLLPAEDFVTMPYVINVDDTFKPLSECENGETVYVSQPAMISSISIAGIYSYHPRIA